MSETGSSSLAIVEKRPQRPGGCVGIFFQLFDWNRRFAKKKLFPKKLLPPARAEKASKKFGADDKLPKLRLIADENNGGFPNVNKNGTQNLDSEQKHRMQTPGLVARLMGLDSMPAVQRDKSKKTCSKFEDDRGHKVSSDHCPSGQQDANLEKVSIKHELRPQKLQKTGPSERQAVSRFGAEALQLKNVLPQSRKHHPKLATPVKSPKSLSGRNASRLIGAATRILEPGLHSRNRAKCALPYSRKMHHTHTDEVMVEAPTASSPYYANEARLSRGQSSCRNCGNQLDISDSGPNLEEQPSISNYVDPSSPGFERSIPRSPISSLEPEKERLFQKSRENLTAQEMNNVWPRVETHLDRTPVQRTGQTRWHLASQQCSSEQVSGSSTYYQLKLSSQNQALIGIPRLKSSNLQSDRVALALSAVNENKEFNPFNRRSSGRAQSRMPAKLDSRIYDAERKLNDRRGDPLLSTRKRTLNVTRQGDISGSISSTFDKQKNISCNAVAEKMVRQEVQSTNGSCIKSQFAGLGESKKSSGSDNKDYNVVSFTFSSPAKQKGGIPAESKEIRDQNDSMGVSTPQKDSELDKMNGQECFQNSFPLTGDTLGALIDLKLKELTSQEDDELGGGPPKRTSAAILQELISALNVDRPFHQKDLAVGPKEKIDSSYCEHTSNVHRVFQAKQKKTGAQVWCSNYHNTNLSPLSVLEACFSNESCISSSLDDSSVHTHADFMDFSCIEPRQLKPELDLMDSATSLNKGRPDMELVTGLVNHISDLLCSIDLVDSRLKGSKLTHAKEVILNAELVCGNAVQHNSDGTKGFTISFFIVNELETLASVLWTISSSSFSGYEDMEGNLLKGFLFDCVVEYLDSRFGPCSKGGTKRLRDLSLCMNTEMLIRDVVEEIRRWTGLAGFIGDELIEREMSSGLGKWTDFEIEAIETGAAIDKDILQSLVDEIVVDLLQRAN